MLSCAIGFIAIVIFMNEGTQPPPPPPVVSNNFKSLKSKIDLLEQQAYQAAAYEGLKTQIASYYQTKQITTSDYSNLNSLLELGKSKSLVISFDETENNSCMNTNSLAKWAELLRKQETIMPYAEAQNRIQRYKHMVQFLEIGNYISDFKNSEYDAKRAQGFENQISNLIVKPGVSGCPMANQKRNEWLGVLTEFQNKHQLYLDYKNENIKSSSQRKCEIFQEYPAYIKGLNLQCNKQ